MAELQRFGWIMPVAQTGAARTAVPQALVLALWIATLSYSIPQGLMYGTRTALYMDVTNPAVAATQFTAYMALLNLSIAYSATWQGIAIEAFGYPITMAVDAATGLLCLALVPWIRNLRGNAPDGRAPRRARISALLLGALCLAWLPIRANPSAFGAAAQVIDTLYTVVFVAAALFLLAGAVVLGPAARGLGRVGVWFAPSLLLLYARRWIGGLGVDAAILAEWCIRLVPVAAGLLLFAMAARPWEELATAQD
jgi:PAT family beta-lactamase induction signal transducer AmpG